MNFQLPSVSLRYNPPAQARAPPISTSTPPAAAASDQRRTPPPQWAPTPASPAGQPLVLLPPKVNFDDPTHPFDEPYCIMRALSMELKDLRSAIQVEQRDREFQVKQLNQEIGELHKAIGAGRDDLASASASWCSTLSAEMARVDQAARELHSSFFDSLREQREALTEELHGLRRDLQRLSDFAGETDEGWRRVTDEIRNLVMANSQGDNEFARHITQRLDSNLAACKALEADLAHHTSELRCLESDTAAMREAAASAGAHFEARHQAGDEALRVEVRRTEQSIEEFRVATAATLQKYWKAMTGDFADVRGQISGLKTSLEVERRDRQAASEHLGGRIDDIWAETTIRWCKVPGLPGRPELRSAGGAGAGITPGPGTKVSLSPQP